MLHFIRTLESFMVTMAYCSTDYTFIIGLFHFGKYWWDWICMQNKFHGISAFLKEPLNIPSSRTQLIPSEKGRDHKKWV